MTNTESTSSDNSDNEIFTKEFLENIPEDSDSSDNEGYFNDTSYNTELNSTLILEVGLIFLTWKAGLMSKGFMFAKEGQKNWNITEENKQYCATVKVITRKIQRKIKLNHQKHIDLAANGMLTSPSQLKITQMVISMLLHCLMSILDIF